MAGKKKAGGAKKGSTRPKTAAPKRKKGDDLLDVERPYTAPSAEATAQFLQLKTEIYGMSLYQQISPGYNLSYFKSVPSAAMRLPVSGSAPKGKGKKGKKGKKK